MRSISLLVLLPLLLGYGPNVAPRPEPYTAPSRSAHDTSHPFVLANDADFLAALIALYEESIEASLAVSNIASSRKIRAYATKNAARHNSEITRLRSLLTRYGKDARPDFHFASRMPELRSLSGAVAERYYLSRLIELLSAKIELAEFASGTAKFREVKKLANGILESKSDELAVLNRLLNSYRDQ